MTDEERQKIVARLLDSDEWPIPGYMAQKAANEIKRLDAENRKLKKSLHHILNARETDMGTAE